MRTAILLSLATAWLALPSSSSAAPPLQAGEIVVAGYSYAGFPAGLCPGMICRVHPTMGTVAPISAAIPPAVGTVVDLAIDGPTSVLAIARLLPGYTGTLLQIDVASGAVTPLASGFAVPFEPSVTIAQGGRVFVSGSAGILEIDRGSGSISVFAAAASSYQGIDAEPGGASLLTTQPIFVFPFGEEDEFVRIDVASGSVTPLGQSIPRSVTEIEIATNGDRIAFERSGFINDGSLVRWTPSGYSFFGGGEAYQASVGGIAVDLDNKVLVAGDGNPDPNNYYAIIELQRLDPTNGAVLASFDFDFGISAIDVAPSFPAACADGADNDDDGAIDYPADIGCNSALGATENPRCDDGIDNDGDSAIDWDGAGVTAADPGCQGHPWSNSENPTCGLGAEVLMLFPLLRRIAARGRARGR